MNYKIIMGSAIGLALFVSCQNQSYRIEGSGEALSEGDTLYLTRDLTELTPTDTIVVKDGKFAVSGETDSTYFCLLYSASNRVAVPFFVEPGTIRIERLSDTEQPRVSGTLCNNEWQVVSDTMTVLSRQMNQLAAQVYSGQLSAEDQARKQAEMEQLNERFKQFIFRMGQKNAGNEFGYFIVTFYGEGLLEPAQCKELIEQMPDAMRQRPQLKELEQALQQLADTAQGSTISDFKMDNLNGQSVSILAEAAKHQLTLLDFWASWCGPCRRAMPHVKTVYQKYHDKGLGIIGISLDEQHDDWAQAISEMELTWTQVSDLKGWDNAIARAFGIRAIPHMIVIDQQGRIVKNGVQPEELDALCESLLK